MLFRTTLIASVISTVFANEAAPGSSGWCGGSQDQGIWLYEDVDFGGLEFHVCPNLTQCINVSSFNDRASSAHWQNNWQGTECFCFYEHADCKGKHKCWGAPAEWNRQPANFIFDDLNDQISSVSRVARASFTQSCIYDGINWTSSQ